MIALVGIGYFLTGMVMARWVKIRLEREVRKLPSFGQCNDVCRIRPKGCRRCRPPARHSWRGVLVALTWLCWPPVLFTLASVRLIELLIVGVSIAAHSAPAKGIGQVWTWFWTDPQERKTRKAVAR